MRVIITGGATGIGKSCVQSLFFSGMNIDLIYFNSYNDIIKISTLFSEKNTQAINYVNNLLPSKNIIDFLSKIKKSRFNK